MSITAASLSKICYNAECRQELKSERPRRGWQLRTGEFVELCDRCGIAYEEERFCYTFHARASGWRNCESCGKRVHCGCIVSAHTFMLLDPGGIECIVCARKNVALGQNVPWSSPFFFSPAKIWSQLAGSGPVPWRQAPTLFNSAPQPEFHRRVPYEINLSTGFDRLGASERSSFPFLEKRKIETFSERSVNGNLKLGTQDILENGYSGSGITGVEQPNLCSNKPQQLILLKQGQSNQQFGLAAPHTTQDETNSQQGAASTHFKSGPQAPLSKKFRAISQNGLYSLNDTQVRNGKPEPEANWRDPLLPRYWPKFNDQDLQQISGDSDSVITPLFEKMLSASDAGRIGRLVLPKKCAEAYFPPISQPEGLPIKVQDSKGKEWTFQFRFWPNNNSRMYVLEGVTPCIQNMELQAGDVVTFCRIDPGGRLFMGYRKAPTAPASDQDYEGKVDNGVNVHGEVDLADPTLWSNVDKSGYMAKESVRVKATISRKRKNGMLVSSSSCVRIDSENPLEVKITRGEAQGLLRPPPNCIPTIVVIQGFEFEEYEDVPILGKPTICGTDNAGEEFLWVQCEDCSKWRKLPASTLVPSKWTCSSNSWDPSRSSCSAAEELTAEELEDFPSLDNSASKKIKAAREEPESVDALDELNTLADLAIPEEEEEPISSSSQARTKHPRHRPGCSCIVCIQPPSGKGHKHRPTCICTVCQSVKCRHHTMKSRQEKKQPLKKSETESKMQPSILPEKLLDEDNPISSNAENSIPNLKKVGGEGSDSDSGPIKFSKSSFKGLIDLNIQPEREEDPSPDSRPSSMMKLLQDATQRYLKQQVFPISNGNSSNFLVTQTQPSGGMQGEILSSNIGRGRSHENSDKDHPTTFSMHMSGSTSAIG